MSKIYGKMWAEGKPCLISTRQGSNELTVQLLYGSASDSHVAIEATVKWSEKHGFVLSYDVPEDERLDEQVFALD